MQEVGLGALLPMIEEQTRRLKSGVAKKGDFPEFPPTPNVAIDLKRRGDLAGARDAYISFFEINPSSLYSSAAIWGLAKIFILGKNWAALKRVLQYHFDLMVVWNRIMREEGNDSFFEGYTNFGMSPHFEFAEFNPRTYLQELTLVDLDNREAVKNKFIAYGGSDYWRYTYDLTLSDWMTFQNEFPKSSQSSRPSSSSATAATASAGSSCLLTALCITIAPLVLLSIIIAAM
ncbi:hypothetical protein [uncultured Adlercreutzia sp.]|uniref:hypothetical protein n=1 Tax=uncultured Adlercreutzia sp. TaxID=875803 RepID=UPI0026F3CAF1|nr:hypothetical protein [uncultured Adlercreutzia sp.]